MTINKTPSTFRFNEKTKQQLKEISYYNRRSQTAMLEFLIEEEHESIKIKNYLAETKGGGDANKDKDLNGE